MTRLIWMKSSIALSGTTIGLRVALSQIYLPQHESPNERMNSSSKDFSELTKQRFATAGTVRITFRPSFSTVFLRMGTKHSNPASLRSCLNFSSLPYVTLIANQLIVPVMNFVEMGGLEPPSKHRTKQLSTRLVFLWFSTHGCRKTGHRTLIL